MAVVKTVRIDIVFNLSEYLSSQNYIIFKDKIDKMIDVTVL